MSKRRGKILTDADSVERRKWYSDLQMATMTEVAQENAFHKQQHMLEGLDKEIRSNNTIPVINLQSNAWVTALNAPLTTKGVVVCFHGIGQNQAFFKRWHKTLNDDNILLCGVCLPGRSYRAGESYADSIRNISVAVFMILKTSQIIYRPVTHISDQTIVRPLVLFGCDVGALIAYEVAKLLQDHHYHLTSLIAVSAPSPYLQGQNRLGKKHCFLSDADLTQRMLELGGVPDLLRERKDLLKYFIPFFRSDYYLFDKYVIQPPATVLHIPEAELVASLDLRPAVREAPAAKKAAFGRAALQEPEQEEELVYPVVLYRLHCPITTLRVEDDPFVTEKEISEWTHMSNNYEHIVLEAAGPGAHCNGLCTPQNESAVAELLLRYCALTTLEAATGEVDDD